MTNDEYKLNYHNRKIRSNRHFLQTTYTIVGHISLGYYAGCLIVMDDLGKQSILRHTDFDMAVKDKIVPLPLPG